MTYALRQATLDALREQLANLKCEPIQIKCEPIQKTIVDLSNIVEQLVEIVVSIHYDVEFKS